MILSTIRTYNTKSFQIHRIDVESQQPIFPYKAERPPNALHFQFYVILNRFKHRFTYLDCLILTCILINCLFTHIELFFYSFNPNSNPVDFVSRIDLLDAFTDHENRHISNNMIIIMSCFFHCDDIMYPYECFIHSFHYYLFWNIYSSLSVIIHIVALSFQKLLVKRKLVLFDIGHGIELTLYWYVLLLMLSFVHSLLLLLLIISYLFQTLLLNTY